MDDKNKSPMPLGHYDNCQCLNCSRYRLNLAARKFGRSVAKTIPLIEKITKPLNSALLKVSRAVNNISTRGKK